MQLTPIHLQTMQNTSNESLLDTLLPNEVLGIIFDQVINQKSQPLCDIYSILLTCKKWKSILEENPCISLAQTLFQLKGNDRSTIIRLQEYMITDQKKHFSSQEFKLIDRLHTTHRFEKLLMIDSQLFHSKSLFLSLLDRYPWDPEICQKSANKNIQHVAEEQASILNSLISGTVDQRLNIIKNDFIEKLYLGSQSQAWQQVKTSVISTLKIFPHFNNRKVFIKVARCFGCCVFDIHESFKKDRDIILGIVQQNGRALEHADESLKKDREIVLLAVQQMGRALQYADESLKKDREIVLAAVQQNGRALQYADESFKKDREIILATVQQDGWALQYADESFKKDREIVLIAVQQNGKALQYTDKNLKKDREIVLAAVQQDGLALQFADESLKKNREIVLAAVKQNYWAFAFADESLKKPRDWLGFI